MNSSWKRLAKQIIPNRLLDWIGKKEAPLRIKSILAALREQGLLSLYHQLFEIIPDITRQYSNSILDSKYSLTKVRAMHSFQITLVNEALRLTDSVRSQMPLTIVDIGDSAGTHLQYIKTLHKDRNIRSLSVNIDSEAVRKIKKKGLEAIRASAEDIATLAVKTDIFLSFEMLEHLENPCRFLRNLSRTSCKYFVITVPYLAQSRVGFHHIRQGQKHKVTPEDVHIFELSPKDWRLIFIHSGWAIQAERIYLQYPKRSPLRFWWRWYWGHYDFEGFYGVILMPDKTWSSLYDSGEEAK